MFLTIFSLFVFNWKVSYTYSVMHSECMDSLLSLFTLSTFLSLCGYREYVSKNSFMLEIWFHCLQGEVVMQKMCILTFLNCCLDSRHWFVLWQTGVYLTFPSYSITQDTVLSHNLYPMRSSIINTHIHTCTCITCYTGIYFC